MRCCVPGGVNVVLAVALTCVVVAPVPDAVGDPPPAEEKNAKHADTGEKKRAAKGPDADWEKDNSITDPWIVGLLDHCRAVAKQKTKLGGAMRALELMDHVGLLAPLRKGQLFYTSPDTGIKIYGADKVELVDRSRETHDMVDSLFAYAVDKEGKWQRVDSRRMDEYDAVVFRSSNRIYIIRMDIERVMILRLKPLREAAARRKQRQQRN